VRRLRLERDITQEDLAFKARVHRTFISELEVGDRNPTYKSLLRVAEALGVPLSDWIARAEAEKPRRQRAKPRSGRTKAGRTGRSPSPK
jgi:transcriptional regulator with XRE-family HTH domain